MAPVGASRPLEAAPEDEELPQLHRVLDGASMAAAFAPLIDGATLLSCTVDRIKYRPRRNCSITYRLTLRDGMSRVFEQIVGARACRGGESLQRFRRESAAAAVRSPAGPAISHLPDLDMVAHWWPNDPKLAAPALLADDTAMRERVLPAVVAALSAGRGHLLDYRMTLVQVVPGLRLCARVDLQMQADAGSAPSTCSVYAKADAERDATSALAALHTLYDSPARTQGRLRLPQPLLRQPQAGLYWQRAVPGTALQDTDAGPAPHWAAQVGAQLASLHDTPVPTLPTLSGAQLLQQLDDAIALLGKVDPAWQPLLQRVGHALRRDAAALDAQPAATLHGDLHLNNILCDADTLAFIDFDSACRAAAAHEIGGWAADMLYRSALDASPASRCAASWQAFMAAYAQASTALPVPGSLIAWGAAHALVCKRAYRSVVNLKPGRLAAVPSLLALADTIATHGSLDAVFDTRAAVKA